VRALCARGHEVRWYSGRKYRAKIEATGAHFVPWKHARDYDDARIEREFAGRAELRGLAQLKFDMKHVFIDNGAGQARDIAEIAHGFVPDGVLCEAGTMGALFHHEASGVPLAVLGVIPLARSSIDTAPFGLGLAPSSSPLGRLRNRALNWLVEHVLFADVQRHWNATRAQLGLPPTGWWLDAGERASVYMQPTIPRLEHPRSDLPGNYRFIGMIPPDPPRDWTPPDFWRELDGRRPIVHVTQGTIANQTPRLIAPALEGLADEDVLVVVATGGPAPETLGGLRNVARNARIGTFLSYPDLLPKTSVMLTNGGFGGVQMALAHGVPVVVAGASEDKPEVATRVACSGAGLDLKTSDPTPAQVRAAVRTLLDDAQYRERARQLAAEYARYDAVDTAARIVEGLVRSGGRGIARAPRTFDPPPSACHNPRPAPGPPAASFNHHRRPTMKKNLVPAFLSAAA
jgi:UDP:flavonoid glycosyltransferase YjiC (YdhE family)